MLISRDIIIHSFFFSDQRIDARSSPNYLALLVAAICVAALMLPTTGDADTQLPTYLHLTLHQKLVFAYTLGK